jgi:hypothetical protein
MPDTLSAVRSYSDGQANGQLARMRQLSGVVSLMEIIEFLGAEFVSDSFRLSTWEAILHELSKETPTERFDADMCSDLVKLLDRLKKYCQDYSLRGGFVATRSLLRRLEEDGTINCQVGEASMRSIREQIMSDLHKHKFVQVRADAKSYLNQQTLFGEEVAIRFPSAKEDIQSAGNSFAVGLGTATIFHLMRVTEYGLRALARERKVKLPSKRELEWAEWQTIITGIEEKINLIRAWKRGPIKDKALSFYGGAIGEFYVYKDVYRNHVMHTRESYDMLRAESVMQNVREFIKRLAVRIEEKPTKSINWKKA